MDIDRMRRIVDVYGIFSIKIKFDFYDDVYEFKYEMGNGFFNLYRYNKKMLSGSIEVDDFALSYKRKIYLNDIKNICYYEHEKTPEELKRVFVLMLKFLPASMATTDNLSALCMYTYNQLERLTGVNNIVVLEDK
jgi:hypothetical protein